MSKFFALRVNVSLQNDTFSIAEVKNIINFWKKIIQKQGMSDKPESQEF